MSDLFTIARKNGSGAIIWSDDQKRYIAYKYQQEDDTIKHLAEEFSVRPESIRALLRKMRIEITNKKIRNFPRNSHFFSDIDTPEKAYWLGMFYSDGNVGSNDNNIRLALKDKEHIEKFQRAIGAINNKILEVTDTRFSHICYRYDLSLRDKQLHDDLIKWGVMPNKSYLLFGLPQLFSPSLMRHFIRGYFDGDGGLSYSIENERYCISFTGNKMFLEELRHYLNRDKLSLQKNTVSEITYQFKLNGRQQVLSFLDWLYADTDDSIRLNRKYDKYIELSNYPALHARTTKQWVWPAL